MKNVDTAKAIIKHAIPMIEGERGCGCANASSNAIVTHKDNIPNETKERLSVIFGKYL
jgi:5'-methylthioadenosine phosphorylase